MLSVRAHFGSIPIGRAEISVDEPTFLWIRRAWHASYSRYARRAERFPNVGLRRLAQLGSLFRCVSKENS